MLRVGTDYEILPHQYDGFEEMLAHLREAMQAMPGCESVELYRGVSNRSSYLVISTWSSRAEFDEFIASEPYAQMLEWGKKSVFAADPAHRLYESVATMREPVERPTGGRGRTSRVMIVDDSKTARLIIRDMLEGLEHLRCEILEAGDGGEALALLDQVGAPDLALIDWNMPGMSGMELLERLRARFGASGFPIMMVTSESDLEHVSVALQAGADEYLMKPFRRAALAEKLEIMGITPEKIS